MAILYEAHNLELQNIESGDLQIIDALEDLGLLDQDVAEAYRVDVADAEYDVRAELATEAPMYYEGPSVWIAEDWDDLEKVME